MTELILSLEGTEYAPLVASCLAILAAILHASLSALQKGRHDPWLARGAIDFSYFMIALPLALFVLPWPEPELWPLFIGVFVIHTGYKLLQAMAFVRGNYTVVYPVIRGSGPIFAILAAYLVFDERFTHTQWIGVGVLLGGIFGLALYNFKYLEKTRDTLPLALFLAVCTGVFVALYTAYDAWAIRIAQNPISFVVWFFVVDGIALPPFVLRRYLKMANRPALAPLMLKGAFGGVIAFMSFGSIMLATRLDKVGEAAILRETSTVFAALIGWYCLKGPVGPFRSALMAVIALGAVIVEFGA